MADLYNSEHQADLRVRRAGSTHVIPVHTSHLVECLRHLYDHDLYGDVREEGPDGVRIIKASMALTSAVRNVV